MRCALIQQSGEPDVIEIVEREDPRAGPGDAVIDVQACSVNHLDLWVRRGMPGRGFPLPLVPGSDVAGVVCEVGPGVHGLSIGQEVVVYPAIGCGPEPECLDGMDPLCSEFQILGAHRDGGMAEKIAVPARNIFDKPSNLSHAEAAAIPVVFITAWHMLVARAKLCPSETVLIQAAGSGVSHAGIQIAKLLGARVIAASSTPAKLELARSLGADETINYKTEDVADRVKQLTDGRGVQVAFDHVGAATWEADFACLAKGGRYVTCGSTTGREVTLNLGLLYYHGLSVLGSTLGSRGEFRTILDLMSRGRLTPHVDRTFPLDQLADAHRYLESQQQAGKVVITIAG